MNGQTKSEKENGLRRMLREAAQARKRDGTALICDLLCGGTAFVLARCHLLFGAYPLGAAFVSCLPGRVPVALAGAVLGSLSLGKGGFVYAMICLITVFLRIVISGGEQERTGGGVFSEPVLLRMSGAVIGGFIAGVYEILLSGFSLASVLYAVTMILSCGICSLLFGGLFFAPIKLHTFLFGNDAILIARSARARDKFAVVYLQASLLSYLFFLTLALSAYVPFGISLAYVFAGAAVLFVAGRFGTLRAMAAGFFACLGVSGNAAVAFALGGAAAGVLYPLGVGYALLGYLAAVGSWGVYSDALAGLLAVFPEAAVTAVAGLPLFRKLRAEAPPEKVEENGKTAADMVNTMVLSYRGRQTGETRRLEEAMIAIAPLLRSFSDAERTVPREAYERVYREAADLCCKGCGHFTACGGELGRLSPDTLVDKLTAGEPITESDLPPCAGEGRERLVGAIRRSAAALEEERYRLARTDEAADTCEWLAKLMNEARLSDVRENTADEALGEQAKQVFRRGGFPDGAVRLLGERQKYLVAAGEDVDGSKITDLRLRQTLAETVGAHFGAPEYFRRGDMVLMACKSTPRFRVEAAIESIPRGENEENGDSTAQFSTPDGRFFAILSDGMGSGEEAGRVSTFAAAFLSRLLGAGCDVTTSLHLLNRLIRRRGDEYSASVDLFSFDLLSGEAQFCKSGAAPSYIKRGESLFRVRSQTVPIGLLKTLDAERIRVDTAAGDLVVMVSDGVCQSPEEAPWLLDLLNRPVPDDLSVLCRQILSAAANAAKEEKTAGRRDDMTVLLLRVRDAAGN